MCVLVVQGAVAEVEQQKEGRRNRVDVIASQHLLWSQAKEKDQNGRTNICTYIDKKKDQPWS